MPSDTTALVVNPNGVARDDESSKTRTRVSHACARCRTRKDRCDGQRPSCSNCINAQQVCSYEPATKKRGLPEGYVRGLEKLLAILIGKIDGFENQTFQLLRDHQDQLAKVWNHVSVGEELHTIWKESVINQELEVLLSNLDQGPVAGQKRKRERDDTSEEIVKELNPSFHLTPSMTLVQMDEAARIPLQAIQSEDGRINASFRLPEVAFQLLDQYFAHTHCWFPVIQRPQVTRACYQIAKAQVTEKNKTMLPLLWAILAYSSAQLQTPGLSNTNSSTQSVLDCSEMRALSLSCMMSNCEQQTMEQAQAYLILSLLDVGLGDWKTAWSSVGHAVRIALSFVPGSNDSFTPVIQGCAVLDTMIAMHLRTVPHLRRTDIESLPLLAEDGYEEWEPWHASQTGVPGQREPSFTISCFNCLTRIFSVVSDVLRLGLGAHGMDRDYIRGLLGKLHQLQSTFPGQKPPNTSSPPHHIYLQLFHVAAQIRLVELPVDSGTGSLEMAKLACNVISLCSLCDTTPSLGLTYMPPILSDCMQASMRLARISKAAFGSAIGLPPYEDFEHTAQRLAMDLSGTWPVFNSSTGTRPGIVEQPELSAESRLAVDAQTLSNTRVADFVSISPEEQNNPANTLLQPLKRSQVDLPLIAQSMPSILDVRNATTWNVTSLTSTDIANELNNNSHSALAQLGEAPNSFDLEMMNSEVSVPPGISIPGTSPSFQGDEIDAIFYEMAHLDTNEWTSERAVDLKDFGFADDLTFQAFCNDPDRVAAPSDSVRIPLSSNSRTWNFTSSESMP